MNEDDENASKKNEGKKEQETIKKTREGHEHKSQAEGKVLRKHKITITTPRTNSDFVPRLLCQSTASRVWSGEIINVLRK